MARKYMRPYTIEELLHSRQHNPVASLSLIKDICRRIVTLEKVVRRLKEKV